GLLRVAGSWQVTAQLGALGDVKTFTVSAAAPSQVQASVDQTVAEKSGTLNIFCKQMDPFGNDTTGAATFSATNVTTSPSSTVTPTTGGFSLGNLVTPGVYTATCTSPVAPHRTDSDTFAVADTQPPTITAAAITAATEPTGQSNGVHADGAYASGATLTVHLA